MRSGVRIREARKPAKPNAYLAEGHAPDGHEWPNGFELAELLFAVDHVINVPVIKTHFQAWFTMSMKAFVGMSHHRSRREFHTVLQRKQQPRGPENLAGSRRRVGPEGRSSKSKKSSRW